MAFQQMLSLSRRTLLMFLISSMLLMVMKSWAYPLLLKTKTFKKSKQKFKGDIQNSCQAKQSPKSNRWSWRTGRWITFLDTNQHTLPFTGTRSLNELSSLTKSAACLGLSSQLWRISSILRRAYSTLWACILPRWKTTKRCRLASARMEQISCSRWSSFREVKSTDAYSKLTRRAWTSLKFNSSSSSRSPWGRIAWKK